MSAPATTVRRRAPLAVGLCVVLLVVMVLVSLLVGTRVLAPGEVFAGLIGRDPVATPIIWQLRMPRTLVGLLVGVALGIAGVLSQSVTRNPLADPGLLGISAGGAVGVVVGSAVFGVGAGVVRLDLALLGSALATIAVYAFARRSPEGLTPVSMTLAGLALTAFLGAVVSGTVLISAKTMDQYRFWAVGALTTADPATLLQACVPAAAGIVLALAVAGGLDAMALGDDTAAALGVNVVRTRLLSGAAVVLLSGTAVAMAGPIAFIGLVIPHMARAIVGTGIRRLILLSAVLGPLLLLVADVAGRLIARPSEVQVGVVTAIVGTPFFIWLIRRVRGRRT